MYKVESRSKDLDTKACRRAKLQGQGECGGRGPLASNVIAISNEEAGQSPESFQGPQSVRSDFVPRSNREAGKLAETFHGLRAKVSDAITVSDREAGELP